MKGNCTLMHKNTKVAACNFDTRGYLKALGKIYDEKRMPVNIESPNVMLDLQRWLLDRSVATNRKDLAKYREFYGSDAFLSATGVSFFDCYWFSSANHKDWEQENPYDNWDSDEDSLYLMEFFPEEVREHRAHEYTTSPNFTIPGNKQRLWYKTDTGLYLLHGNPQKEMNDYKKAENIQNVKERNYITLYGEIFTSILMETSKDIERVPFNLLYNICEKEDKSKMQNLQACCEKFQIPDWRDFFANMFEFDEKIGNTERELSDIGVLRNSKTFEIIKFEDL